MVKIDIPKILAMPGVKAMMDFPEAHIEDDNRPTIAATIVKEMAPTGNIGDIYEALKDFEYYLRVRHAIATEAIDLLKDQAIHIPGGMKIDPNTIHIK